MGPYASFSVLMDFNGSLWVFMRSYWSLWVLVVSFVSLCSLMGPYRSLWVIMGPYWSLDIFRHLDFISLFYAYEYKQNKEKNKQTTNQINTRTLYCLNKQIQISGYCLLI